MCYNKVFNSLLLSFVPVRLCTFYHHQSNQKSKFPRPRQQQHKSPQQRLWGPPQLEEQQKVNWISVNWLKGRVILFCFPRTATTTTTELTTEVTSTEPQPFEYITFNPEFNEIAGDSYINRPHLNVAYSTSRATESARFYVWLIVLVPLTKILSIFRW